MPSPEPGFCQPSLPEQNEGMAEIAADICASDYIEVARLRGDGPGWIIFREILPNALSSLFVESGIRFTYSMLLAADATGARRMRTRSVTPATSDRVTSGSSHCMPGSIAISVPECL